MAHAIAQFLVQEGEHFMNDLEHNLAQEQVAFLEKEVDKMSNRVMNARKKVLDFQNENNLVSPQNTAENVTGIVNNMEAQLATLKTNRDAMLGYLMPENAQVAELNLQIAAIEKQMASEKSRLTSPTSKTLNKTIEEFQRLEMKAEFAQDMYKTALITLEKGRVDASRTIKKLSVLQSPTQPEYPLEPRRIYNSFVSLLVILMTSGIIQLLAAIIRDHKD